MDKQLKVLITGDNASTRFGGEAILPYHYFRLLNARGIETWLVTHARCRNELEELLPHLKDKMAFIEDSKLDLWLFKLETLPILKFILKWVPNWGRHVLYQTKQQQKIRELTSLHHIDVVHQVTPVSPKLPSYIYDVGAPVIIGPMNGGMEYPAHFKYLMHASERMLVSIGKASAQLLNILIPGKRKAALLLTANERTRLSLPLCIKTPVVLFLENGIDLKIWKPEPPRKHSNKDPVKYIFLGRLIDWKGVQYLIQAFGKICQNVPSELHIVGDGPMKESLEQLAHAIQGKVIFHGAVEWKDGAEILRQADILILPSVLECGGAVVMEGMVCGLPVIATAWGGPLDYLDDQCGILVEPDSEEGFINGLAAAMLKLAESPELREKMGLAGQQKAVSQFSWQQKIEQILTIYKTAR